MRRVITAFLCLFILVSGCATTGGSRGSATFRGSIAVPGPEGPVALDEQGSIRTLAGPSQLLDQLVRIPGAMVEIQGSGTASTVRVAEFTITDAGDGLRPIVGWLIVDQMGVQINDSVTGTRIALRGQELATLKNHHGARVWVTGSVVGPQTWLIAHWGILVPR